MEQGRGPVSLVVLEDACTFIVKFKTGLGEGSNNHVEFMALRLLLVNVLC